MKKIAELVIGNMIVSNTMYEDYGSPTLFIVHKDDRKSRCYYSYGYYQARCINCGAMFTVKPNITWYGGSVKVFCPACGRVHTGNAIMYGDNPESLLPDNIVMKVVDFKDKVELRLKYKAVYFGRFTYKTYSYVADVKETYTFDVKNAKVHWRKTESNIVLEDKEIGYVKDFFELKEKTALWFYSISHKINKGNSFGELLKALRNAVNKKIKAEGKTPKPLYIGGNYKNRLYGNVLNLAHRVRFWDAKNIKQLAYGEYDTVMFERKILGKEYLPERFEEKLYAAMQKTDYISALCKVLKVPNIPHTRKNLTYENFALLHILLMCDKEAIEVQKILPFLSDTWPVCRIGRAVIRASQSCRQSCNKSHCPACGCRSHHSCTHAPQFSRSFPAREWGSVLQRQGACGQCP